MFLQYSFYYIISSLSEWAFTFFSILFIATFYRDFKHMKLKVKVCPRPITTIHLDSVQSTTHAHFNGNDEITKMQMISFILHLKKAGVILEPLIYTHSGKLRYISNKSFNSIWLFDFSIVSVFYCLLGYWSFDWDCFCLINSSVIWYFV